MIELPEIPAPNGAEPYFLDPGTNQRGAIGGPTIRLDRAGARYGVSISYAPMRSQTARVFVSRLVRAKSEGVRIPFPLLHQVQGSPGAALVNGADQAGRTLALKNLTPGYLFKEGSWLSIEDANGQHYLHNVATATRAAADGTASLPLCELLRRPFDDECSVHVAKPMIEGFVLGDQQNWTLSVGDFVQLQFAIEEAA